MIKKKKQNNSLFQGVKDAQICVGCDEDGQD